jgi:hypothetical protein
MICHDAKAFRILTVSLPLVVLQRDPFGTAWSLGAEDRAQAQNQSVCTLRDFLELAAQRGKQVIFDLYRPPRGHPYRDTWITHTLEVIHNESSIHSHQVRALWDDVIKRSRVKLPLGADLGSV